MYQIVSILNGFMVKPSIPRTPVTWRTSLRKVSAMNFARSGSPGIRTVFAKSPFSALMWGVAIIILLFVCKINLSGASRQHTSCGSQRPLRAKYCTRVLLAAAPTTPPFIRHWRRSSLLPDRGARFMLPLSCLSY